MRKRNIHLSLWIDEKQKKELDKERTETGQNYSQIIRRLLRKKQVEFPEILQEVRSGYN